MTEHSIKVDRFGEVGNPDEPNDSARSGNPDSKIERGFEADAFRYRLRTPSSHLYRLGYSLCIIAGADDIGGAKPLSKLQPIGVVPYQNDASRAKNLSREDRAQSDRAIPESSSP